MKLHFVHTNDMHNHFPRHALEKVVRPGSILFDSGDALAGSNTVFKATEMILEKMRKAGFTAMAMGNREFHYIRRIVASRQKDAGFPILSANVVDLREKAKIMESLPITKDGVRIALFGLTVPQYPVESAWEKITGWRFLNPVETAKKISAKLRREGAALVFCLSHLGFQVDQNLAEKVEEIDIIFGGHSHTVLNEPVWKGKTAILQTGSHGRFVGSWDMDAEMNEGRVQSWTLKGGLVENRQD